MTNLQNAVLAEEEEEEVKEIRLQVLEPIQREEELPILDGMSREQAFLIADRIQDEARKLWCSNKVIFYKLKELSSKNAYSFTRYMLTTSESQTVLGDFKKHITNDGLRHFIFCLLRQAKAYKLDSTFQYRKLKKEYFLILDICKYSPNKIISNKLAKEADIFLENLCLKMSRTIN